MIQRALHSLASLVLRWRAGVARALIVAKRADDRDRVCGGARPGGVARVFVCVCVKVSMGKSAVRVCVCDSVLCESVFVCARVLLCVFLRMLSVTCAVETLFSL